ncbi:hypothetical protein M9Y10_039375 [Tritrichomonas musculus]|uniref:USP domain-containing protein n=1 Tax=Tritrichomonas musculus TaxID=1915356 RepID=A0ABR2KB34_9EUKA
MIPEEDFETWKLIITTVSDDISSFSAMLPDFYRMMESIEKTNSLPGNLETYTDDFIENTFPTVFNAILETASQMKIREDNINDVEVVSDFLNSSIKLSVSKINDNSALNNISNDDQIKIISRKIKLAQIIFKFFDKIDLSQKPNENEKVINQSFLFNFYNDLNAIDQYFITIDNMHKSINNSDSEELLEKKALFISILFKTSSKVIYSATFESKTFTNKESNKAECQKEKLIFYYNQINTLLNKTFPAFEKVSEANLRKFDSSLLDSLFETITKSIQIDFSISKDEDFPLIMNLLDPSYLHILSNYFNCSYFDKILYSLKTLSLLCKKTEENYNNNKEYFESDKKRNKYKLKVFFIDKEILIKSIINDLYQIQNLHYNKEFGDHFGNIYSFIIENKDNVITIDYLENLWKNMQFVFAADQSSFYKIFEKITKVMNEKDSNELVDFILQQNSESTNKNFLDLLYSIALNLQKNKFEIPFSKLRDLFWEISFGENDNEEKEFARKKINSLCHFCSNEMVEKLITSKFHLIQEVSEEEKENKSSIVKENEFIIKLCQNSINKDEEEIRPDLCNQIVQFCVSHLKDKNCIDLLTKVCTTQKITLEKEMIEKLSNTSNKFLTNILFSSGFDDDYIENLFLSLNNIDSDLYDLIEKYVITKNKHWESIENDYLTCLPFEKEDLLWKFSLKKSKAQKQFMNKLCEIYSNNDGILLSDEQMIKSFLNRIEDELDQNESKENIFQLLKTFIGIVDETNPYLNDIKKHKTSYDDSIIVSCQGIQKTFKYSKRNSTLVAYFQIAKELNVPLNQLTLIFDDSPVPMSKTFSQISYIRSFLDFIPIVGDQSNIKIKHLRYLSPSFQILRSNLMIKLISFLSNDNDENEENLLVLMDLLNDLPTSNTTYSMINNFDKMEIIQFTKIFPTNHSYLFMYNLAALKNTNDNITNEFVKKNGIEYFIDSLTKVNSLTLICDIMNYLKSIMDKEELVEKHSNRLFEALMRICMCVSDIYQEKIFQFLKKLKPTSVPQFDTEFKPKFAELEKKDEKEKEEDEHDEFMPMRRRLYDRFGSRYSLYDDPFLYDDFLMRHEYLMSPRLPTRRIDHLNQQKKDEKVQIDNEMPLSHVISNVITMTLIKRNVYINPTKKYKSEEIPKFLKMEAISAFEKLPIPSEYFEVCFLYLTPSNYKDFLKAYSPHVLPLTEGVIKFIIDNLDTQSSYLPFVMEILKLTIKDIIDEQKRNIIFTFILDKVFVLNRDVSIDDDSFNNAMIIASCASTNIISEKINNLKIPDFDKYNINGADYKQDKSKKGLKNLGCTCYLNSILQQFYHLPMFRKILIEYNGNEQLFKEIGSLFLQMRDGSLKYVSPKNVTDNWTCWDGTKLNPRVQEDASEFIIMLIDKISSIIPNSMFNGKLSCKIEGINNDDGKYVKKTEEPFSVLILPINQSKTLEECLNAFNSPSFYTNENQYYADSLKKNIDAKQSDFIEELPDHLILQLKRFEYDYTNGQRRKINSKVSISQSIDVESICKLKEDNGNISTKYNLAGVIQHMGSTYGGHYFSYVMDRDTKMWYKCNDTEVTSVTIDDVIANANGGDCNAYILFYDRCDIDEVDDSLMNQNFSQHLIAEKIMSSNYNLYMTKGFFEFLNQISKRKELQQMATQLIIKTLPHASVEISNNFFDLLKERFENDETFSLNMQKEITDFKFLILNDSNLINNLFIDKIINPMLSHSVSKHLIQLAIETIDFAFERISDSSFFFKALYSIVDTTIKQKRELEKEFENNKNEINELNEELNIISDRTTYIMKTGIKEYIANHKDLSPSYITQSIDLSVIARLYNIYENIPSDYIELLKDPEFLSSLYNSKNSDVSYFIKNYTRARKMQLFDVDMMLKAFFEKESIHLKMESLFHSILLFFKEKAFPMTWSLKFKYNNNYRTSKDVALCYTLLCRNGVEKEFLISHFNDWVPNLILNDSYEARKMALSPFRYLIPHQFFKKAFGDIPNYNDSYVYTSEYFNSVELIPKTTLEMKKNVFGLIQCLIKKITQLKEVILNDDYSSRISFPIEKYKGLQLLKLLNVCIKIFNDFEENDNNNNYPIDYSEIIELGEFLLTTGFSHPFDPHIVYILKILREKCPDKLLIDSIPSEDILMSPEKIEKISSTQLISYCKIIGKIVAKRFTDKISLSNEFYEKIFKMILFNLRRLNPIIKTGKFFDPYNRLIKVICIDENSSKIILNYIDNNIESCLIDGFHSSTSVLVELKEKRPISKYIHSYNFNQIFDQTSIILRFVYHDAILASGNGNMTCYDTLFDDTSVVFQSLCTKVNTDEKEYQTCRHIIWDYLINNTKKRINECSSENQLDLMKELFRQFKDNYNLYYFNFYLDPDEQQAEIKYITKFVLQFINENDDFNNEVIDILIFLSKNSFYAMNESFDVLKTKVPEKLKDNEFISDVFSNDFYNKKWELIEEFSDFALNEKTNEEISSIFEKSKIVDRLNDKMNAFVFESESDASHIENTQQIEFIVLPYKLLNKYDVHFTKDKNSIITIIDKNSNLANKSK